MKVGSRVEAAAWVTLVLTREPSKSFVGDLLLSKLCLASYSVLTEHNKFVGEGKAEISC